MLGPEAESGDGGKLEPAAGRDEQAAIPAEQHGGRELQNPPGKRHRRWIGLRMPPRLQLLHRNFSGGLEPALGGPSMCPRVKRSDGPVQGEGGGWADAGVGTAPGSPGSGTWHRGASAPRC